MPKHRMFLHWFRLFRQKTESKPISKNTSHNQRKHTKTTKALRAQPSTKGNNGTFLTLWSVSTDSVYVPSTNLSSKGDPSPTCWGCLSKTFLLQTQSGCSSNCNVVVVVFYSIQIRLKYPEVSWGVPSYPVNLNMLRIQMSWKTQHHTTLNYPHTQSQQ